MSLRLGILVLAFALGFPALAHARPSSGLGELGKGGIALLSVGAVGVGVGIGFIAMGKRDSQRMEFAGDGAQVNFRPAGAALVGFCGVALIGGIAMLAVDSSRSRRFAMSPVMGRGFAGLSVRTRF